jgi:hypothetical protein
MSTPLIGATQCIRSVEKRKLKGLRNIHLMNGELILFRFSTKMFTEESFDVFRQNRETNPASFLTPATTCRMMKQVDRIWLIIGRSKSVHQMSGKQWTIL